MVQTRSQAAADAWKRFNKKQQVRKARLRNASLAAALKEPELTVRKRNRKPRARTVEQESIIPLRKRPEELPYFNLDRQDTSDIEPKNKDPPNSIKDRRAGAKTVRILEPAEQHRLPIRTNVPWPLVGTENLGSSGSAPMDISAGSSVKTPGPWPKEQNQLNRKSSKGHEKAMLSPPWQEGWNEFVGRHDSRERGVTGSPSLIFYPVWELTDPSSHAQGWLLKGYVSAQDG